MAKGSDAPKNKGGRPPDTRPVLTLRVPHEDDAVLRHMESRTALTPDETARMLLHFMIWEVPEDAAPSALRTALGEGRRVGRVVIDAKKETGLP